MIEPFRGISSLRIRFTKIIIPKVLQVDPRIRAMVYIYSVLVAKDKKKNVF